MSSTNQERPKIEEDFPTSCRSARESADSTSAFTTLSGEWAAILERCATLNGKPSPAPSWRRTWKTKPWMQRLSGPTSPPLTLARGVESWMESLRESRASPSVTLENVKAPMTTVGSGRMPDESSTSADPSGSSSKTSVASAPRRAGNLSRQSSGTWAPVDTRLRGMSFRRGMLAHHTSENDYSSWPIMTASVSSAKKRKRRENKTLHDAAIDPHMQQWHTPTASETGANYEKRYPGGEIRPNPVPNLAAQATEKWATPTTRDYKDGASPSDKAPTNHLLGRQGPRTKMLGPLPWNTIGDSLLPCQLNPLFVEWLMGLPLNWSNPSHSIEMNDHTDSGMPSFLPKPASPSLNLPST